MNILNQIFEKIYVISSFPTQNRLNDLMQFFYSEYINYELIIATKKKYFHDYNDEKLWLGKGNFSLLSANESIFLKEFYIKSKTFCVLEDDIFFDKNYKKKLQLSFNELPPDWQVLNLGYHINSSINHNNSSDTFSKLINKEHFVGTHIIGYKSTVIPFLLEKIENNKFPMDYFLNNIKSEINLYNIVDKIFYASSFRNDELDKFEFYKRYKSEIC